jgi:membrane dipeptidase
MKFRFFPLAFVSLLVPAALLAETDAEFTARARALHEKVIVMDTHLDTPANLSRPNWDIMERHSYEKDRSQVDYPRMVESGFDGGFWAIYTGQGPRTPEGLYAAKEAALNRAAQIRAMVEHHPAEFELAFTSEDAARIHAAGKRIVYQSIENSYPIGKDITLVKTFYDLGVRMMSPAHTSNNDLADSASDSSGPEWKGLSPLGKEWVAECNRLGIIIDLSHSADSVFDQVIEMSKTPIILSHSGPKGMNNHPRNIDDERLKKLAAKGGVIQINSLSGYLIQVPENPDRNAAMAQLFAKYGVQGGRGGRGGAGGGGRAGGGGGRGAGANLSPEKMAEFQKEMADVQKKFPVKTATFEDFMAHVLYTIKLIGTDHVGFGADWDGGGGVEGMWDITGYPKVTERLLKAGYSEQEIANMWGGNVLRLLKAAEDYAASVKAK